MEYIKTTIMLLALLVTVLWITDILNPFISTLLLNIFLFLYSLITLIQNSKENKINTVEENVEIQKSPKKKQKHPICKGIQLAVWVVFIAIGVYGGAFKGAFEFVADIVAPIFGGSPIQTDIIDKIGYPIGVSDTYEGITISADAIIGDSHNACMIFTIAKDDGTPFVLPKGVSAKDLFYGGECSGAKFPHIKREGERPRTSMRVVESNGKLQIIQMFGADDNLAKIYGVERHFFKGKNVTAQFDNLSYLDENADKSAPFSERWVPVLEGRWKLRYEFDYKDCDVTIPVDEQFIRDGLTFTVKDITISPIAIQANYKVDAVPNWIDNENGSTTEQDDKETDRFSDIELLVTKKDGTVLDLTGGGGSLSFVTKGITLGNEDRLFEEIVPMEEIVSVTVGDVVIDVNK